MTAGIPTSALDYELPPGRIAQRPLAQRDGSRLLHVAPSGELSDRRFAELPMLLQPGDVCVVNDTRVRAARLRCRRADGGDGELLVIRHLHDNTYLCLAKPARRMRAGTRLCAGDELEAVITGTAGDHPGARAVALFARGGDVDSAIARSGTAPLPPYIREPLRDADRYQTVYAHGPATSAAAPTAGLHFTPQIMDALARRDIAWASVRLEVGLGTFTPMRTDLVERHTMHEEAFSITEAAAQTIKSARRRGGRVVAVGTTVARVLETCAEGGAALGGRSGATSLFINPGHEFRAIDGLLTNFHQPRSSLLALLAAFVGMDRWRSAYEHALAHDYRFLSFGDCMLCWRRAG